MIIGQRVWIPVDPKTGAPAGQPRYFQVVDGKNVRAYQGDGALADAWYASGLLWELA